MEARVLITADQVKRIAGEAELAAGVVEKDYALTWLLRGLYLKNSSLRDSFVLKGGTAMRKGYFPETWRFSEDVDFTVVGDKTAERIRLAMQAVFETLRSESGIGYSLESFHATEGAIIASVRFVGPLNFANRIRHDITLKETMVRKPERRPVRSAYPDLPEFDILAYPLMEILAEKIRSMMQRGYSRDYYDVWRLLKEKRFKDSEVKTVLLKKCELNEVEYQPELLFDVTRLSETRSFWSKGLGHLIKELPEFELVISDLKESLRFLVA